MRGSHLEIAHKFIQDSSLLCCKYSSKNYQIIVGAANGKITLYDRDDDKIDKELIDNEMLVESPVTSLNADGEHLLATYAKGYVKEWNVNTGVCLRTIKEGRQTLGIQHQPNNAKFITYGDNGEIWLYDEERGVLERKFAASYHPDRVDGHVSRVFAAKFHPNFVNEFITGGWDDTVQYWDLRKQYSFRYFSGPHLCGEGLDIEPNGNQIIACGYQGESPLTIWDYKTGSLIKNVKTVKEKLYCGKWIAPMYIAIGSSEPCFLKILNTLSTATVITYKIPHHLGVYGLDSFENSDPSNKRKDNNMLDSTVGLVSKNTFTEVQLNFTF